MGLDVYLERCPDLDAALVVENDYNQQAEAIWSEYGEYDQMTQEQKDAARGKSDALQEKMGLVEYGKHPDREKFEIDSSLYPDHYFKIGYFRSSYNSGGINSVFRRLGLPGLYDIFDTDSEYHVRPDWQTVRDRVDQAISAFDTKMDGPLYDAHEVSLYDFGEIDSPQAAIARYIEKTADTTMEAFSSREGLFYKNGLDVVGALPGRNCIKSKVVYLVTKQIAEHYTWYRKALEIVKETIDFVLSHDDPQNFYLCWSS